MNLTLPKKLLIILYVCILVCVEIAIYFYYPNLHTVLLPVETVDQVATGYSKGCEGISLYMGLKYKGYLKDVSVDEFMSTIPRHEDNPYFGFVGDLNEKTKGKRQTIYTAALASWGKEYGDVIDNIRATPQMLVKELENGNPSVVYITNHFAQPIYKKYDFGYCVTNGHVVLLTGYDYLTHQYIINDCWQGIGETRISEYDFEHIYNYRKYAVTIR